MVNEFFKKIRIATKSIRTALLAYTIMLANASAILVLCLFLWNMTAKSGKTFNTTAMLISVVFFIACAVLFLVKAYNPIARLERMVIDIAGQKEWMMLANETGKNYPLYEILRSLHMHSKEFANKEYSAEILKKQAEFSALQSQINPHFLYNTLESIRGQAMAEGVHEIARMTEALSTFFRYNISKKGNFVTLEEELKNIENYLLIQQYRFNNRFTFNIKFDDTYDEEIFEYVLPKLTLQPVVENSIYHGLEPKVGKGSITARITTTPKRLIINISDDGVGMDMETVKYLNQKLQNHTIYDISNSRMGHTGMALINVNKRIKLLFGDEYGLTISSTPSLGTDVEIVIPLLKKEDIKADGIAAYDKRETNEK